MNIEPDLFLVVALVALVLYAYAVAASSGNGPDGIA